MTHVAGGLCRSGGLDVSLVVVLWLKERLRGQLPVGKLAAIKTLEGLVSEIERDQVVIELIEVQHEIAKDEPEPDAVGVLRRIHRRTGRRRLILKWTDAEKGDVP